MKNFKEFEELLDSDECRREKHEILKRVTKECDENDMMASFPVMLSLELGRYELRKYHEWSNN